jgi:hypothetical protein
MGRTKCNGHSLAAAAEEYIRVDFGYCPRCGCLRFFVAKQTAQLCGECLRTLDWIYRRARRKAGAHWTSGHISGGAA